MLATCKDNAWILHFSGTRSLTCNTMRRWNWCNFPNQRRVPYLFQTRNQMPQRPRRPPATSTRQVQPWWIGATVTSGAQTITVPYSICLRFESQVPAARWKAWAVRSTLTQNPIYEGLTTRRKHFPHGEYAKASESYFRSIGPTRLNIGLNPVGWNDRSNRLTLRTYHLPSIQSSVLCRTLSTTVNAELTTTG